MIHVDKCYFVNMGKHLYNMHDFTHTPIVVHVLDVNNKTTKATIVFVGTVQPKLKEALDKFAISYNKKHEIPEKVSPLIVEMYGKKWKDIFGLNKKVTGGTVQLDELDANELAESLWLPPDEPIRSTDASITEDSINTMIYDETDAYIDVDDILNQIDNQDVKLKEVGLGSNRDLIFSYIDVFPMDKVVEFKHKLSYASGIPAIFQHIWCPNITSSNDYDVTLAYKIKINYIIRPVFINQDVDEKINGVPIFQEFFDNKNNIQCVAHDHSTPMRIYPNRHFYCSDFRDWIQPDTNSPFLSMAVRDLVYYGFILLFFPWITPTIFQEYLTGEKLQELYSEMFTDKQYSKRFRIESSILNDSYNALQVKNSEYNLVGRITGTVMIVESGQTNTFGNLRDIFDNFKLSETYPCVKGLIRVGSQAIKLVKTYGNHPEPYERAHHNTIMVEKIHNNISYFIWIHINGDYTIKSFWREDLHADLKYIKEQLKIIFDPLLSYINEINYSPMRLQPIPPNPIFSRTDASYYYMKMVTDEQFDVLVDIIDGIATAGFAIRKENSTIIEYYWQKGQYMFERKKEKNVLTNQYEYMSNALLANTFNKNIKQSRVVTISNISGYLRFQITGVSSDHELQDFLVQVVGIILKFEKTISGKKISKHDKTRIMSDRILKNLKLHDPKLYDPERTPGSSQIVYSRVCQKAKQPVLITDDEYSKLNKEKINQLVKYYNFTTEKPVYYSCPNKQYPFINFLIKKHPQGFCLPCCQKMPVDEKVNKLKQLRYANCLSNHVFHGERQNVITTSNYIAMYGKQLDPGRISRLPESSLDPLFYNRSSRVGNPEPECATVDGYFLYGLDQNYNVYQNVGVLHCIAHMLQQNIADFIVQCTIKIDKQKSLYSSILNGEITNYFHTSKDFIHALGEFPYTKQPMDAPWNEIFLDIIRYYFNIQSICFIDKNDTITFRTPPEVTHPKELFLGGEKFMFLVNKDKVWTPIYHINTEVFKKTGLIIQRLFEYDHVIVQSIMNILEKFYVNTRGPNPETSITFSTLQTFSQDNEIPIDEIFISDKNLVYMVRFGNVFFPCVPSYYYQTSFKRNYGMLKVESQSSKYSEVVLLIQKYNKWVEGISNSYKLPSSVTMYPLVVIKAGIIVNTNINTIIGLHTSHASFWITPQLISSIDDTLDKMFIMYHPDVVFDLIHTNPLPVLSSTYQNVHKDVYTYYAYDILLNMLARLFHNSKNTTKRETLKKLLNDLPETSDKLRKFMESLDSTDQIQITEMIKSKCNVNIIRQIDNTVFHFDRFKEQKLRENPTIENIVSSIMEVVKEVETLDDVGEIGNVLSFCAKKDSSSSESFCDKQKMKLTKSLVYEFANVMQKDLQNPLKQRMFDQITLRSHLNYYKFNARPNERTRITVINDIFQKGSGLRV